MIKRLPIFAALAAGLLGSAALANPAPKPLELRHGLILFACETKAGQKISLRSVQQGSGYALQFHGGQYAATVPAGAAYFAYAANNDQISFDTGRHVYQLVQYHDGDARVEITSSKTGKEVQVYDCWDQLTMRLNQVAPQSFRPYTDAWENYLQRRFLK